MSETLFDRSGFFSQSGANLTSGYPLVDNSRFVFMIGLAIDVMFFAVLIGAFFVLREGAVSWPPQELIALDPRLAGAEATCLMFCAIALGLTVRAQNQNALHSFRRLLGAALLFISAFLALSVLGWQSFLKFGTPLHPIFGGLYLTITALFDLHVLAAFGYIVVKYRWTLRWQRYTRSGVSLAHLASFVAAMLVIWVGMFAVVFL